MQAFQQKPSEYMNADVLTDRLKFITSISALFGGVTLLKIVFIPLVYVTKYTSPIMIVRMFMGWV